MALQQIGIASEIVNLAFGLLLGAIAVAVAFGLGSRDIAGQVRECWTQATTETSRAFKEARDRGAGRRDPRYQLAL